MIKEKGCQCFGCQNSDNIDRLYGYYYGCYEVYRMVVQQLKKYGIKEGSIGDDNLEGLLACCSCNLEDCGCLLAEVEEKVKEQEEILDRVSKSVRIPKRFLKGE